MPYAYPYVRFSSAKQEKGASRDRQLEDTLALCARNQWEIPEAPIEDLGVSAWKGNHLSYGNLGRFADRVRSGEIESGSILVVENLDRLSRQEPRITQRWLEDMTDLGLRVATVSGGRIYDRDSLRSGQSIMDIIEILMKAKLAHEHSENISKRLKDSWVRRRAAALDNGRVITGKLPGWLRLNEYRQIEPIPERAETVRLIYKYAADGLGSRAIARKLNDTGVSSWGNAHHHAKSGIVGWEATQIAAILSNSAVEGDFKSGRGSSVKSDEKIIGYYPVVVDADLVARARTAVAGRRGRGGARSIMRANLFQGSVYCDRCNSSMTLRGSQGKPARYLQCSAAFNSRGCSQKSFFPYQPFEKAALAVILPLALDDRYFQRPDHSQRLSVEVAEARKAVADNQSELKRIADLLAKRESPTLETKLFEIEDALSPLQQRVSDLEKALQAARGAVSPQEHLRRVLEVRDAVAHDDTDTRLEARLKVSEALRAARCRVVFIVDDQGTQQISLEVMDGMIRFEFDRAGNLLSKTDLLANVVVDGEPIIEDLAPHDAAFVKRWTKADQ